MLKLLFDSGDHFIECRKVPIVGAQPSRELPCAFDGVEFGAVWWKEDEREILLALFPPSLVQSSVMETSIIENDDDLPMRTNGSSPKFLEERRKSPAIE